MINKIKKIFIKKNNVNVYDYYDKFYYNNDDVNIYYDFDDVKFDIFLYVKLFIVYFIDYWLRFNSYLIGKIGYFIYKLFISFKWGYMVYIVYRIYIYICLKVYLYIFIF